MARRGLVCTRCKAENTPVPGYESSTWRHCTHCKQGIALPALIFPGQINGPAKVSHTPSTK